MYNNVVLLFSRFTGFFLISPLFAQKGIPKSIRLGTALVCSLILAPPLSARHTLNLEGPELLILHILREGAIGYLMGFLFSLLFEAAAFAGQIVGTVMGFSLTELLDPQATSSYPLMARLYSVVACALFLALDLHHPLLRLLYGSFEIIPPLRFPFTHEVAQTFIAASSLLFKQALAFAAFPLTFLLALIALFALLARFLPIFWIGFPLQLLVGLFAIAASTYLFVPLLQKGFAQFWVLFQNLVVHF